MSPQPETCKPSAPAPVPHRGLCAKCGFSADVYGDEDWDDDREDAPEGTCVCTLFQEVCPNEGPCVDEQERDWTEKHDPDLTGSPKYREGAKEAPDA